MEQGALPLESPPETLEQAMRAEFERLPRSLRRRGYEAVVTDELLAHCLAMSARARLRTVNVKIIIFTDSKNLPNREN